MGTWRLVDSPALDAQKTLRLIEECVEAGITTFDEADIYGDYGSETMFGKALALNPSLRDQIEIVTKCGIKLVSSNRPSHQIKQYDTSKDHILESVDNSLMAMDVDQIDLLLLHRPDPMMDPDEVATAFSLLLEQGKVRHFGVSNFSVRQFELLQSRCPMPLITNQLEISLLHRDLLLDGSIDYLMQHKKAPMAWSPFGGGRLFEPGAIPPELSRTLDALGEKYDGATYDQLALAWLYAHPSRILPILGTKKTERVKAAAASEKIRLNRDEWFALWTAAGGEVP
jgi:predicted oxidoreductase